MSVMDVFGPRSMGELPAPPGTALPPGFPPFSDLAKQLGLPSAGLYTPWAARASGLDWEDVTQPPDTNVAAFGINDLAIQAAQLASMGQPLPFIVAMTPTALTTEQVKQAVKGTPYDFYETQAVYSQDDPADPPRPVYMHWLQRRSPGDTNDGNGSVEQAVKSFGGTLLYSFPVEYNATAKRKPPATTFTLLMGGGPVPPVVPGDIGPVPLPQTPPSPPPPAAVKSGGWGLPVLAGLGFAAVTFFAAREALRGR